MSDKLPRELLKTISETLEEEKTLKSVAALNDIFELYDDERFKMLNKVLKETDFNGLKGINRTKMWQFMWLMNKQKKQCVQFKRCTNFHAQYYVDKYLWNLKDENEKI